MPRQLPVHRAIVVVDVERFGDRSRTNLNQLAIREGLYKALTRLSGRAGSAGHTASARTAGTVRSSWFRLMCRRPAWSLACRQGSWRRVTRHNAGCAVPERMRLRVALHAGEIYHDAHGVTGTAINYAFRLAEAPALRSALEASPGVLALIVSDWLYDEVVRHDPAAVPGLYRQVQVTVKETVTVGWIRVPEPGIARAAGSAGVLVRHGRAGQRRLGLTAGARPRGLVSGGIRGLRTRVGSIPDGLLISRRDRSRPDSGPATS